MQYLVDYVLQILSNIQIFQNIQCCKPFITSFTSFIFMVFSYIQNNGFRDVTFVHSLHETRQNICLSHEHRLPPAPLDPFFPTLSAPSSFMSTHMNVWLCFYLGADICLSFCSRDYLRIVWKSFFHYNYILKNFLSLWEILLLSYVHM